MIHRLSRALSAAVLAAFLGATAVAAELPLADPPVRMEDNGAAAGRTAPAAFPGPPPSDAYGLPDVPADAGLRQTFLGMLRFGIEINIAIGVLGFVGLFLFFHFWLATRAERVAPSWLLDRVDDAMAVEKPAAALEIAERDDSLLATVALAGLRLPGAPRDRVNAALDAAGRRVIGRLRQRVNYLANIGVLTPMIGLLGTVMGLMKAFNVLGAEQLAEGYRAALLGSAIGEAMVTTAVGLVVGIPTMALHFLCLDRLGRVGDTLEGAAERLAESLARRP